MLLKLLTAIVVIIAAAMTLTRWRLALPQRAARPAPRVPQAEDLVKCGRCGVWLPAGQRCTCAGRA